MRFFFFFLLIIVLGVNVSALSVTPGLHEVDYVPGEYYQFTTRVTGVADLNITFRGFFENISKLVSYSKTGPTEHIYVWGFTMPNNVRPGKQIPAVYFMEELDPNVVQTTGVFARIEVGTIVKFYVPYPEKFLVLEKLVWEQRVIKSKMIFFDAIVRGLGNIPVEEAKGHILITGKGKEYKVPLTTARNIGLEQEFHMRGEFMPPVDMPLGDYIAKPMIEYDAEKIDGQDYYFTMGERYMEILNMDRDEIESGGIRQLKIKLKSYWPESELVVLNVKIYDSVHRLVAEVKSGRIEVLGLSEADVELFIDATDYNPGTYRVEVSVDYMGDPSSKEFNLNVTKAPEIHQPVIVTGGLGNVNILLLVLVVAMALVILNLGVWVYFSKK